MKKIGSTIIIILLLAAGGSTVAGINDGLVAYYPFNGNAIDESGNGNHGTVYGTTLTTDRFGNEDSSYSFDGVDDYIQTPIDSNVLPLSFSVWFKADDVTKERSIVDSDVYQHWGHSLIIGYWNADGTLDVQYHNGYIDTQLAVSVNQWYHVVVNYSNEIEVFVNGNLVKQQNYPVVALDGSNIRFGRHNSADPQWFDGKIDDIYIYNRTLSEDEIQQLYNQRFNVNPNHHDFYIIEIGCVASQLFAIQNISNESFEINTVTITGENLDEFYIQNDNCSGFTLGPGQTCTFTVDFEPGSLGSKVASVNISFTDTELEPHEVPLTGLVTEVCDCNLNNDNDCNGIDWLLFYPDWGRTDCNDPGVVCECDLNEDGTCNGLDWLMFYPDWGREDCPICP
jgi:hypothetical protein